MRKGQMEILGLAILFVIIVFGLLLFMRFKSDDNDTVDTFRDPKMASSVLNTLVKVSVRCDGSEHPYSLGEMWKDCADTGMRSVSCANHNDAFNEVFNYTDNAPDSCVVAEAVTKKVLSETMDRYFIERKYWFSVSVRSSAATGAEPDYLYIITTDDGKCNPDADQLQPAHQPIELSRSTMDIGFGICR